jgi:hypothetical protein
LDDAFQAKETPAASSESSIPCTQTFSTSD